MRSDCSPGQDHCPDTGDAVVIGHVKSFQTCGGLAAADGLFRRYLTDHRGFPGDDSAVADIDIL